MTEPESPAEKGSLALFGAWLLLHEKADDWIRDALRRARETPEALRDEYHRFLLSVEREKEALKAIAAQAFRNEVGHLGFLHRDDVASLRLEMEDLKSRLRGMEEKLGRKGSGGDIE
jgi:hypothetical protein